jgi:hypothetical protein
VNSKQKGNLGLGKAIAYYTALGWNVMIPLTDSQSYDLVVDDSLRLHKVQVKYTSQIAPSGNYKVELRSVSGSTREVYKRVNADTTDILFIATDVYNLVIPADCLTAKGTMTLTKEVIDEYKV